MRRGPKKLIPVEIKIVVIVIAEAAEAEGKEADGAAKSVVVEAGEGADAIDPTVAAADGEAEEVGDVDFEAHFGGGYEDAVGEDVVAILAHAGFAPAQAEAAIGVDEAGEGGGDAEPEAAVAELEVVVALVGAISDAEGGVVGAHAIAAYEEVFHDQGAAAAYIGAGLVVDGAYFEDGAAEGAGGAEFAEEGAGLAKAQGAEAEQCEKESVLLHEVGFV